ncbi:hypothetical protein [Methylobacterium bullatum]|uniref:hypothetical protein n=1 Tax=Methylobacterium bullatum TaxID=570505 RepID=UPI0030D18C14
MTKKESTQAKKSYRLNISASALAAGFAKAGKHESLEPKNSGVEKKVGPQMIRKVAKDKFRVGTRLPEEVEK